MNAVMEGFLTTRERAPIARRIWNGRPDGGLDLDQEVGTPLGAGAVRSLINRSRISRAKPKNQERFFEHRAPNTSFFDRSPIMIPSTPAVSALRQRLLDDMRMRKLGCKTQSADVRAVRYLAGFLSAPLTRPLPRICDASSCTWSTGVSRRSRSTPPSPA
ncbi:hypothetical protein J2W24_004734 [Variovorax boronicumulans]|nr:hypothetical protein [Variovorax boronicumulans]